MDFRLLEKFSCALYPVDFMRATHVAPTNRNVRVEKKHGISPLKDYFPKQPEKMTNQIRKARQFP